MGRYQQARFDEGFEASGLDWDEVEVEAPGEFDSTPSELGRPRRGREGGGEGERRPTRPSREGIGLKRGNPHVDLTRARETGKRNVKIRC